MLWAVAPLPVTSQALLRAAPCWSRYGSVALGVACNAALQGMIVAVSARLERGGRYFWLSSWRRVTASCLMLAMHVLLICGIFAVQQWSVGPRAGAVAPYESAGGPASAVSGGAGQGCDGSGAKGACGGGAQEAAARCRGRTGAWVPAEDCGLLRPGVDLPVAPGCGR